MASFLGVLKNFFCKNTLGSVKSIHCKFCGASSCWYSGLIPAVSGDDVDAYMCLSCGSITPVYSVKNIAESSVTEQVQFHENYWSEETDVSLIDLSNELIPLAKSILQSWGGESAIVLDVGSGRGALTAAFNKIDCQATGIEASSKFTDHAASVFEQLGNYINADIHDFLKNDEDRKYDIVLFWHVVEHIDSPLDAIVMASRKLKKNGLMAIQIPLPIKNYVYPEHLFFPTFKTFDYLSEKANLQIIKLDVDTDNAFITCFMKRDVSFQEKELCQNTVASVSNAYFNVLQTVSSMAKERLDAMNEMESMIKQRDEEIVRLKGGFCE